VFEFFSNLASAIRERLVQLVIVALGFFLALEYRAVISEWFHTYLPVFSDSPLGQFAYLVVLTISVVFIVIFIERTLGSGK